MRRIDRQLNESEALDILENCEYGILSTISSNGYCYGIPLSYTFYDNAIYIHCAKHDGHKITNIKENNKVSFTVVSNTLVVPDRFTTKYSSAIAFGKAYIIEGEEKKKALESIAKKYSKDYLDKAISYIEKAIDKVYVLKIEIDEISGKANR